MGADVYAYGVFLNELFYRKRPLTGREGSSVEEIYEDTRRGERPIEDPNVRNYLSALYRNCWAERPRDRPEVAECTRILTRSWQSHWSGTWASEPFGIYLGTRETEDASTVKWSSGGMLAVGEDVDQTTDW